MAYEAGVALVGAVPSVLLPLHERSGPIALPAGTGCPRPMFRRNHLCPVLIITMRGTRDVMMMMMMMMMLRSCICLPQ
jgi:hypothetical protein